MAKYRGKKTTLPPQGDIGPNTPAQRKGAVILNVTEDSGAVFRRKRRDHALEIMAASGKLSERQCAAGLRLHTLWCRTEMTGDAPFTKAYVDTSPNPSAVVAAQIERVAAFIAVARHIPAALRGPVEHVALKGKLLRDGYSRDGKDASMHQVQLQVALDILANFLGV